MKQHKKQYKIHLTHYRIKTIKEKIAILDYAAKHGFTNACRKYNVPSSSLLVWRKLAQKGNAPVEVLLARKPKRHTVKEEAVALVKKLYKEDPTLSVAKIKAKVKHVQNISLTTIWHITRGR